MSFLRKISGCASLQSSRTSPIAQVLVGSAPNQLTPQLTRDSLPPHASIGLQRSNLKDLFIAVCSILGNIQNPVPESADRKPSSRHSDIMMTSIRSNGKSLPREAGAAQL
jgi:hypothetical protein